MRMLSDASRHSANGDFQAADVFPSALDRRAELQIADVARIGFGLQQELDAPPMACRR